MLIVYKICYHAQKLAEVEPVEDTALQVKQGKGKISELKFMIDIVYGRSILAIDNMVL